MDRPLHSVRTRLDDFLAELATLHYRHGAGLAPELPVSRLYASFPELSSPDTFAAANEALAKARTKDEPLVVRRIQLVRELVATQVEEALAARPAEAVATLEAQARLPIDDQTLSFGEALASIPRESARGRRAVLERAVGNFLWEHRGPYGDRREASLHAVERLDAKDYPSLREDVTGIPFAKWAEAAAETLRRTEDAYRDVLAYVLKKLDPLLRPLPGGDARRHDLQAALQAPWMEPFFRREDTFPAVARWLHEWGLTPNANGRIRIDDEARPGKASRPFVAVVRVPDEVRLVLQPRAGLDALGSLLHEMGHAQHRAHVSENLPVELRRLTDASVTEAYAALFERLLLSPGWLKRYLDLPSAPARDTVRLAAFQALTVLRRHCAKLSYELSLHTRGPSADRADEYADGQRQALFVEPHPGFFLHDVDPQLYVAHYLRAWALETRLTARLTERFNEDFWRNPAAAQWLKGLFARGGTDDAEGLATDTSGTPLALPEAGERLVAILNR
ncbi:peptidase M3 [Pyxidicoccus fallax]|uniref:Peptidase M3 n=1 Tax=Pyxidicoccus fallax TaxID=394095 RepID=A0A848LHC7_9BACT|nr:peptidase M3 [Pyxidicoccus fallax]NMO17165.1 peptidase M3 [Pyxidicoccus fallax]NPC85073.1 peptidase M3 [Pyxidicoccus fallax]